MIVLALDDLSPEIRKILREYFEYRSLVYLKDLLSPGERVAISSSWSDAVDNKQAIIGTFIEYFLRQDFSQKAYHLLYIIDRLKQELDSGNSLYTEFGKCLEDIKRKIVLEKIEGLCKSWYEFDIKVSGVVLDANRVYKLAQHLLNYQRIRGQMLRLLSLPLQFPDYDDEFLHDIDNDNWHLAFEDVIQILRTCFRDAKDIESLMFRIKERDVSVPNDWITFYREICKLVGKNITDTPLQELQEILDRANLPGETLRVAYSVSLGKFPPSSSSLASLLQDLAAPIPTHTSIPIVKFVECLIYQAGKKGKRRVQNDLKNWNEKAIRLFDEDTNWISELRRQVRNYAERSMYLLIIVKSENQQALGRSKKKQMFTVSAWLVDDENDPIGSDYQNQKAVPFSGIPQCIDEILTQFIDYLGRIKIFDLFFQNRLLSSTLDSWQINTGLDSVPFIAKHAWVVRSLERAEQSQRIKSDWEARWKSFQKYNGRADKLFHVYAENDCNDKGMLLNKILHKSIFCIALNFVPPVPHDTHIFTTILSEGVPIILWYGPERNPMPSNFPEWLEKLLCEKEVPSIKKMKVLPFLIWEARRLAEESKHLILLWDDPYRLPPPLQ